MPIFRGVPAASEFQDATVNELEELIEQEAEARQASDAALQSNIDSEESARQSADTALQSSIDSEVTARQSADIVLQGNIDSEESARQSADTVLQGNIDSEVTARQSADTVLQGNINLKADIESPVFTSNSTESLRLTDLGYLKADPSGSYVNDVGSDVSNTTFHSFISNSTDAILAAYSTRSTGGGITLFLGRTSDSGNHLQARTQGSTVFTVTANGTVSNVNGVIAAGSDIKLKKNITDATGKLDDIAALRFVNYDLKDNPELGKQFGVIAQEIEEVFPNLVINTPDTEEVDTTDEEGNTVTETVETGTVTKSVKYSVLTLMAVKALQELKAEKDELEAKHEELIDEVDILRQRIEALESN